MRTIKKYHLPPLLKYPGGKESELKYIHKHLPLEFNAFYEPFLGGGSVYLSMDASQYFVNDKSFELMLFYDCIKNQNIVFFENLEAINYNWKLISKITSVHNFELTNLYLDFYNDVLTNQEINDAIVRFVVVNADEFNGLLSDKFNYDIENFVNILKKTLLKKFERMKRISFDKGDISNGDILANIESALKASFYTHLRKIYNSRLLFSTSDAEHSAIYFFIRQMCYSSMFRYNIKGEFNVPYGGISYNQKNFDKSIEYFKSEALLGQLKKTIFGNYDFHDFLLKFPPRENDFLFLDPPYDSDFSTYANNEFGVSDQNRLAKYLIEECRANFMLIIKNSDLISSLYVEGTPTVKGRSINISSFEKSYLVSFQNRNIKETEHLIITNYQC